MYCSGMSSPSGRHSRSNGISSLSTNLQTVSFKSCSSSGKLKSTLAPCHFFRNLDELNQARPNPITLDLFENSNLLGLAVVSAQPWPIGLLIQKLFHSRFTAFLRIGQTKRSAFGAHILFCLVVIHGAAILDNFLGGS